MFDCVSSIGSISDEDYEILIMNLSQAFARMNRAKKSCVSKIDVRRRTDDAYLTSNKVRDPTRNDHVLEKVEVHE